MARTVPVVAILLLGLGAATAAVAVPVTFHWSPPRDGAPVDHYNVYRSIDGQPFRFHATIQDTTYILEVDYGHEYRVRVSGVSAAGLEGELSVSSDPVELPDPQLQLVSPPVVVRLKPNYPNPFNPQTTISYGIPESPGGVGVARLEIYDIRGQRVRTLPAETSAGWHTVIWDGTDEAGTVVPSGRYVVRLWSDGHSDSWTMTMVK